ncbi:probable inactive serine/threonine-protein kinase fnkC [Lolium rigidum]|uniref:probable inactive serine/threonine-protein kinase fnkC n=1 Tax=Lolium rigidum TaxID=89674 RepID=UPI001F5DAD4E|nr:probable inactive serine/threonine-protein kinase fnkC [Lolium rigidum]
MPSFKAITDARKYVVAGGSKQGLKVAPSPAKAGSNQVSDEAPFPARGGSNNASDEAAAPTVTTFKWRIDGFSSLLEKGQGLTYSNVFQMRGLIWYLKLNPRDTKSGDQNEYVSLQLRLGRAKSDINMETTLKFLIYDQSFGKHHEHQVSHKFHSESLSCGISCMLPLAVLKEISSGFLVNNSCVFAVEFITAVVAKDNDVSETLFVQKTKNICSKPQVYTWNIEDFFVLKNPSDSPEFELCGHKWSIKIYPSGDDTNGNHLSLYLVRKVADTLHKNSAKLIESSISIKNLETGKLFTTGKARYQYAKNFDSWGWKKLISLEDFKDPANAYLVKTKCCIVVELAVIGSSEIK